MLHLLPILTHQTKYSLKAEICRYNFYYFFQQQSLEKCIFANDFASFISSLVSNYVCCLHGKVVSVNLIETWKRKYANILISIYKFRTKLHPRQVMSNNIWSLITIYHNKGRQVQSTVLGILNGFNFLVHSHNVIGKFDKWLLGTSLIMVIWFISCRIINIVVNLSKIRLSFLCWVRSHESYNA